MISKILKGENDTYQLLIPKKVIEELGVSYQDLVELLVEGNKLIVIPLNSRPSGKVYEGSSLKELLERITPENLHSEVDWGKSEGKEEW